MPPGLLRRPPPPPPPPTAPATLTMPTALDAGGGGIGGGCARLAFVFMRVRMSAEESTGSVFPLARALSAARAPQL